MTTTRSDERVIGSEERPARARARLLGEEEVEDILNNHDPFDTDDDDDDDDEEP